MAPIPGSRSLRIGKASGFNQNVCSKYPNVILRKSKETASEPAFQKVYAARVTRSGSHSFPLQLKIVTDTQLLLPVRLPNYLNNGAVTRLPDDGIECYQYAVTRLRSRSRVCSGREQ